MVKKMQARFRSTCSQSRAVINKGDWILYDTVKKTAVLEPDSDTITFFGNVALLPFTVINGAAV